MKGVILEPEELAVAKIAVSLPGPLKPDEEFRLEAQQRDGRKITGGSTFVFKGPPSEKPIVNPRISERDFVEMEKQDHSEEGYLPAWIDYMRRHSG